MKNRSDLIGNRTCRASTNCAIVCPPYSGPTYLPYMPYDPIMTYSPGLTCAVERMSLVSLSFGVAELQ